MMLSQNQGEKIVFFHICLFYDKQNPTRYLIGLGMSVVLTIDASFKVKDAVSRLSACSRSLIYHHNARRIE